MMILSKYWQLFIFVVFIASIGYGQRSESGIPLSIKHQTNSRSPEISIKNIPQLADPSKRNQPIQAGYLLEVDQTQILSNGTWEQISTTSFLWRISLKVKEAHQLNVYFQQLNLLTGDQLYVYSQTKNHVLGAYTSANNGPFLSTDFISGELITIEYNSKSNWQELPFTITEIGVKLPNQGQKGFGDAGSCEVHINCEEGVDWQKQKNGVARILLKQGNLTFWCSGSLVNNTRLDGTPYFLTANHCGETSSSTDYAQWLFYFNYESMNCEEPVFEPEYHTVNGSKLLSHSLSDVSFGSDFKLLLLDDSIPENIEPYYNGWSRSSAPSPSGVTIHHPQGDLKMISTYQQELISSRYNIAQEDLEASYWRAYWNETTDGHGVTEGGSSGSPIFNSDGLIVGSLTGGGSSCTFKDLPDYFGKFSASWEPFARTDSSRVLSVWLDPDNTGIMSLNGTDMDTNDLTAWFTAEKTTLLVDESIRYQNTSFGNIVTYLWEFEGGVPSTSESEDPGKITYPQAGLFNVKLHVYSKSNEDSLVRTGYIEVMPKISPNPGNGIFNMAFGDQIPEDLTIEAFDVFGNQVNFTVSKGTKNNIMIDLSDHRNGVYIIRYRSSTHNNSSKVILSK